MNNTIKAIIKRGIDSITAEKLYKKGYTLNKIKTTIDKKLLDIGLTKEQIDLIKDESLKRKYEKIVLPIFRQNVLELQNEKAEREKEERKRAKEESEKKDKRPRKKRKSK